MLTMNAAWDGRLTGEWDRSRDELDALLDTELESSDRIQVLGEALVLRASRGEPIAAGLADYDRLQETFAGGWLGPLATETRAEIALAEGRLAEARAHSRAECVVQQMANPADAVYHLARAARAALWSGDADGAREDLAALDLLHMHGPMVSARRTVVEAGIAAAESRPVEALVLYRIGLRALRDLGSVWEEALVGIDMATLLDPADPEVRGSAESAREILVRLRARPYLERLQAAMGWRVTGIGAAPAPR